MAGLLLRAWSAGTKGYCAPSAGESLHKGHKTMSTETGPGAGTGQGTMKATLGLTGLTSNAMALIAPGAFLWLTFAEQSAYGAPSAGSAMWLGMLMATVLCLATAVSYAELSKLYPGAGSSYFFAEQAFLSKKN